MKIRMRRLRTTEVLREAVAETRVHPSQLIQPHFVIEDPRGEEPILSMPGVARFGVEKLVQRVGKDLELGLSSVLLFGLYSKKDGRGTSAYEPNNVVATAVARLRKEFGAKLTIMTDVCMCASMDHGHCGILHDGKVLNDESLPLLSAMALSHARAGADVVAPSDMMDGRVAAIRDTLDEAGFTDTAILSYSTKFASGFYGPFRDAADSAPKSGDRKAYQMDPRNGREAVRESVLDEHEGADMLMVKPALAYLDVIKGVREATNVPLAAYNVSGEYSMVKAAAKNGWIDEGRVVKEILTAIVRAGADLVITYHGTEALEKRWL
ncbi:MAG: porphobilinogen synthase [Planctomycetes bacterium]|jgi:porphobilinogen synthase|nr:porphobilinogen synthase [Planctomycetota bacterium]